MHTQCCSSSAVVRYVRSQQRQLHLCHYLLGQIEHCKYRSLLRLLAVRTHSFELGPGKAILKHGMLTMICSAYSMTLPVASMLVYNLLGLQPYFTRRNSHVNTSNIDDRHAWLATCVPCACVRKRQVRAATCMLLNLRYGQVCVVLTPKHIMLQPRSNVANHPYVQTVRHFCLRCEATSDVSRLLFAEVLMCHLVHMHSHGRHP